MVLESQTMDCSQKPHLASGLRINCKSRNVGQAGKLGFCDLGLWKVRLLLLNFPGN